jgi:long-chain acyl-CoA synthetase
LINAAVNSKMKKLKEGGGLTHCLWDKLVFNKVKQMLGGRIRLMITGSAPISGDVLDFLKVCFCCDICEGYGMTETSAASVITKRGDPVTGHVGGPLVNVKIRLRDIPEMNYMTTDDPPKGEVCFWGPSIMKGYFRNPEKTAEAFHNDWLLSGDVGMVMPNGAIKIIDRAKNIFKLSQGEYIAPEKLENIYIQSEWIMQIWIYGDSLRDIIVAFVVLDPERLDKYAKATGAAVTDEVLKGATLKMEVWKDMMKLADQYLLNGLEKPKQLTLLKDQFTIESDLLTPTMKIKRNIAKLKFKDDIDSMYAMPPLAMKK